MAHIPLASHSYAFAHAVPFSYIVLPILLQQTSLVIHCPFQILCIFKSFAQAELAIVLIIYLSHCAYSIKALNHCRIQLGA